VNRRALAFAAGALAAVSIGVGCGSVTAKHSDGGGTGGSHADSSVKDLASDRRIEDAHHDAMSRVDTSSVKDMLISDARATDAHPRDARAMDGAAKDARATDGATRDAPSSGSDAGGACQTDSDCMLYPGAGGGCCGVCQPETDPTPSMPQCLIACLLPLKSCTCAKNKCTGSTAL